MQRRTKRFREPRGLGAPTPFYGFYARLEGQERDILMQAQAIAGLRLGGAPSNPMLLEELLRAYVGASND